MTTPIAGGAIASAGLAAFETFELGATGIATGAVSLGTPAAAESIELLATEIATAAPSVGAPSVAQAHSIAASGVTGSPVVANPALAQDHSLGAASVATAAPTVGMPSVDEVNALLAVGVVSGAPTTGPPALNQLHVLGANAVDSGAPSLGAPVLINGHGLDAVGITVDPVVGTPPLSQLHVLAGQSITASPVVGTPALSGDVTDLAAEGVATNAPAVAAPELFFGTVQERFLESILGRYSCDELIVLLEISHETMNVPIRVNNSGTSVESQGQVYQAFPFAIELPNDDEREPVATVRIANVDRRIGDVVDSITTPATIGISVVSSPDPSEILKRWSFYQLRNVSRTALDVTGDIVLRQILTEPFPNIRITQFKFQNLYRQ